MKTYIVIDIIANGEHRNIQIQTTKLRKSRESDKYGIYKLEENIMCGGYEFEFEFFITYNVEMCVIIGKMKKQKRYTIHMTKYEPYKRDKYQMLHNVLTDVAKVMVSLREEDFIEDGVVILENKR